ncbi:MAG: hypothetical protein KAX13_10125 [Candidatus Krumholzibacteria bacterium]|nr:hypothetical protein [Candidatus Krumholzibacteria bacterium]
MIFQELLELLGRNKRCPNYAAERRIDIFINYFLEDILTSYYKEKVHFVAPEFPLKKDEPNNRTVKLDYLCVLDKNKQPLFVELKTDALYFNEQQAKYYAKRAESWPACIETLKNIIENSRMRFSFRVKYFYLIKQLLKTDLIDFTDESAKDLFDRLNTLAKNLRSQKDKGIFSRDFIKLSRHINACWKGKAKLLYLGTNDKKLRDDIENVFNDKANLLDFAQIKELPMRSGMPYSSEFKQLVGFLKTLK